jgi:uncharacterized protein (TIGR01777 family)
MRIAITGSTGLIGSHLADALRARGDEVVPVVRRPAGPGKIHWDPSAGVLDPASLIGLDVVVNLSGAGIGDRRWTSAYKRTILESRTMTTSLLASAMAQASVDGGPRRLLNGSAIGYYGARGDEELNESSTVGSGFLADVCVEWESAAAAATEAGISVALLRTGIVLSPRGGALAKLLPLFRFGLGGRMGSGRQWQSWISIDDEVGAIIHLLSSDVVGPVNLTAPHPVTNAEFTVALAKAVKRPALIPVPGFGPKLLLGPELAEALLLTGQRVLPNVLESDGFTFSHREIAEAFSHLVSRESR